MFEGMGEYTATFELDSKSDAYAVERLTDRSYDSVREESRTVREGTNDSTTTLAEFEAVRDAARRRTSGRLTVVYERHDEGIEE